MVPANSLRCGSLLIVVAGMSAILAGLAMAYAVRVRADSETSEQVVRVAQARILIHAAMVYTVKTINANQSVASGTVLPLRDNNAPGTWNTAWMRFTDWPVGSPPAYVTVVVGAGPSNGAVGVPSGDDLLLRSLEPRYCYKFTIAGAIPSTYISAMTTQSLP